MYQDRIALYKKLEEEFDSKALVYITSDRPNMEAHIASDVIDFFIQHLDSFGPTKRISLYLYTRGGDTAAAWNIINLLRMYCDDLQVIIPHKAHSAGTIISLGANEIVMTKQATLSPIDPSINTPLNPMTSQVGTVPVSVEAVKGYLEFAKEELSIKDDKSLVDIFIKLTEYVHPLVLGQVYRSRAQIQMLAEKLLVNQVTDPQRVKNIISFLCSDSGSHDYTINRREAEKDLDLKIVKPSVKQYRLIKQIYDNINEELQFNNIFNITRIQGEYAVRRCLLESVEGGSDYFITEGQIQRLIGPNNEELIQNRSLYDGWRHEMPIGDLGRIVETDRDGEIEYENSGEFQI